MILCVWGIFSAGRVDGNTSRPSIAAQWNNAALQGIRDSKLSAPMVSRALAIAHTCMYDAWVAYDSKAIGTQLSSALRLPSILDIRENKDKFGRIANMQFLQT